ncbi:hypothetical protein AAHE18_15G139100 [Arachis hypogaea]
MHSFVLVSQHHHHESPSLNWFSTNLISQQPDSDSEQKRVINIITKLREKEGPQQTCPSILLKSNGIMLPLKLKQVALVQLEIHQQRPQEALWFLPVIKMHSSSINVQPHHIR